MEWSWFPVQLSFYVATLATIITLILGSLASFLMVTKRFKGKSIVETIFFLPLVLPPTVVGFFLVMAFGIHSPVGEFIRIVTGQNILFTSTAAVLASVVVAFPLMYQSIKTGYLSVDQQIMDAGRVDGASEGWLWIFVLLPLSVRSIVTGVVLSFTRAFGEFGATLMVAGNIPGSTQTIPTAIYLALETGQTDIAWYYVGFSIGFSFLLLLAINLMRVKNY